MQLPTTVNALPGLPVWAANFDGAHGQSISCAKCATRSGAAQFRKDCQKVTHRNALPLPTMTRSPFVWRLER